MTRRQIETICWKEFVWRRSFKLEQVHEMLAHLATVSSRGAVIWEIRARDGLVRHLLGADSASIRKITEALQVHGEIEFYPVDEHNRKAVDTARQIKVSHPSLFKEQEWNNLVERAVVKTESLDFEFKNGERIKITI